MQINQEELWKEANRLLGEIANIPEIKDKMAVAMSNLTFNQRHIWKQLLSAYLTSKVFGSSVPTINDFWDKAGIEIGNIIPDQFAQKCTEVCADLDQETAFLFKHFWIETLVFQATMAQLKT